MDILGVKPETWFPVVTLVAGALLKGLFDWRSDKRRHAAEKAARDEARADTLAIRSAEFQREALLELQVAVQMLGRATGKGHHEDLMALAEGIPWRRKLLTAETNEMSFDGFGRLHRYRVRVKDDIIREQAEQFGSAVARRALSRTEEESERLLAHASALMTSLNERIGEQLRTNL